MCPSRKESTLFGRASSGPNPILNMQPTGCIASIRTDNYADLSGSGPQKAFARPTVRVRQVCVCEADLKKLMRRRPESISRECHSGKFSHSRGKFKQCVRRTQPSLLPDDRQSMLEQHFQLPGQPVKWTKKRGRATAPLFLNFTP